MNYNCIYFHLKKLQLGPIDVAFQKLQYALKNSARAIFFFFSSFSNIFLTVFIVDLTEKIKIVCTSSKFNTFYFS
jgi:hypothetical protein